MDDFLGCKLAILVGNRIVTILRDNIPTIPWPDHWDMPGGLRELGETPEICILRELREELGLNWPEDALHWREFAPHPGSGHLWFFISEQPDFDPSEVIFGDEGQEWRLAPIDWYLTESRHIDYQSNVLKLYLSQRSSHL